MKALFLKISNFQIVKYGFVGGISTFIHIAISFLYLYYIEQSVFIANTIAFIIAFIFSYTFQSLFVFGHKLQINKVIKYFAVQCSSLFLAFLISHFLFFENLYIQTIVISFLLPLITFFIHKFWTFRIATDEENKHETK
ncbi:GtrA family protein [Sulfurimonas sp.]|uniref:GtrA family protein n=1 Tax=Sulfurimonas sp. TaxID=2022749 RepID=UPI0039E7016F